MAKKQPEQELQKAVVWWLAVAAPDLLYFSVPNAVNVKGGGRAGAFNKEMGVRPGVADFCFILPHGRAAFIELKAPKGTQTDTQKEFQKECTKRQVPYHICRSLDEVEAVIREWGVRLRIAA